ncbi:MAG: ATP-binding cassette domain-containing protein [Gammaproteobacteria bacterium]|nr:ATP-binding cassette domain-containing protein [Gammaproteobacteria bacterium]MBI5615922.1 ATP-binding cassette domain-containing protein [Gammaproteobacteria bacterium]
MARAGNAIEIRGLVTRFGPKVIHENLDLDVRRGEVLAIVGGSGSGKSTLLRTMIMLNPYAAGRIRLLGAELGELDAAESERLRERIGVTFQQGALFSALTVQENVALPLREHTDFPAEVIAGLAFLKVLLAGLPPEAAARYPRELSGGMLKRAGVARALALDPELLFLDEPTAGLDPVSASAFDELVLHLKDSLGLTVVMITHDLDTLWRVTDRVAFLAEKRVLRIGSMAELAADDHPEIEAYFSGPRGRVAQQWNRK